MTLNIHLPSEVPEERCLPCLFQHEPGGQRRLWIVCPAMSLPSASADTGAQKRKWLFNYELFSLNLSCLVFLSFCHICCFSGMLQFYGLRHTWNSADLISVRCLCFQVVNFSNFCSDQQGMALSPRLGGELLSF